jgi:hypothetical protein
MYSLFRLGERCVDIQRSKKNINIFVSKYSIVLRLVKICEGISNIFPYVLGIRVFENGAKAPELLSSAYFPNLLIVTLLYLSVRSSSYIKKINHFVLDARWNDHFIK